MEFAFLQLSALRIEVLSERGFWEALEKDEEEALAKLMGLKLYEASVPCASFPRLQDSLALAVDSVPESPHRDLLGGALGR